MKLSEFLEGKWDESKQPRQNGDGLPDVFRVLDESPRALSQVPCNVITLAIDGVLSTDVVRDPVDRLIVLLWLYRELRERCIGESRQ